MWTMKRGTPWARIPIQGSGIVRRTQLQEMMDSQLELPPEDVDRSSRQLKNIPAWFVWNEGRTRRLTASSRDGLREDSAEVHAGGKLTSMI